MAKVQKLGTIQRESTQHQEPGRGTIIFILGILSIILLGPFVGIPAWVMGNTDLKKIKVGLISITEKGLTNAGMILGIIGTFLSVFIIIIGIAVVVGINIKNANTVQTNRDAIVSDGMNISSTAQMYYRRPTSMGGGGNSFEGFEIPENLKVTENGNYKTIIKSSEAIQIVCEGNEIGNDGDNPVKVTIDVSSENITTIVDN